MAPDPQKNTAVQAQSFLSNMVILTVLLLICMTIECSAKNIHSDLEVMGNYLDSSSFRGKIPSSSSGSSELPTSLVSPLGNDIRQSNNLGNDKPTILIASCPYSASVAATIGIMNRNGPYADCLPYWPKKLGFKTRSISQRDMVERGLHANIFKGRVLFDDADPVAENVAISTAGLFDLLPVMENDRALVNLSETIEALPVRFDFRQNRIQGVPGAYFTSVSKATSWTVENLLPYANNRTFVYRPPGTKLVPYIIMERTVATHVTDLSSKCTAYSLAPVSSLAEYIAKENGLKPFLDLTSSSHWDVSEMPLTMYGYSAGMFESTGFCTRNRTMGVSASDIADSLSFFIAVQRSNPQLVISKEQPLKQLPPRDADIVYNASKIYVTHIVSDGDNLSQLQRTVMNLEAHHKSCLSKTRTGPCSPRAWTVSGQTRSVSAVIRLIYDIAAANNGTDSFILPPSGASYFYPASALDQHGLMQHRNHTIEVARNLNIEATVLWDFFFHFFSEQHKDYIRSFINTPIKGIFWSAAPWLLSPNEKNPFVKLGYKSDQVFRDEHDPTKGVILFNELTRWDSVSSKDSVNGKGLTYEMITALLKRQSRGSLNFIYDIAWGIDPQTFDLYGEHLAEFAPDVQIVDHRTLIRLAYQKYGLKD